MLNRRIWTLQPQVAVGVDWSNPITRGLCFLVNYSDIAARNLVNGQAATFAAGTSRSVGAVGRSIYTSNTGYAAQWTGTVKTSDGAGTGTYTFLSLSAPVAEANISSLISQAGGGGGGPQAYILANTGNAYGASAGNIAFGNSGALNASVSGTLVDGKPHCYVYVQSSTQKFLDVDGISLITGISTADIYHEANPIIQASAIPGYSGWSRPHPHFLQAAWNRDLSLAERISIGRNAWQLFAPLSRPVFATSAAGVSTYTLSSATWAPGSITATGVTPRVSVAVA